MPNLLRLGWGFSLGKSICYGLTKQMEQSPLDNLAATQARGLRVGID